MPGTIVPPQMFDHECNVLKGWWHPHALDKSAPLASGELVNAGSVVYLDMNGEFRLGLPENSMPMFAWPNSADFDVSADVGNIQSQNMMALPCTGPYELQTTEFDDRYVYHPNDHLAVWDTQKTGYAAAYKGKVFVGNPYTDTICGVVSKGATVNDFGKQFVSLWTYYLPIDLGDINSSIGPSA
jgi:hypothetical protein